MVENREASPIEVKAQPDQLDVMENESPKGFRKNPKLQSRLIVYFLNTCAPEQMSEIKIGLNERYLSSMSFVNGI